MILNWSILSSVLKEVDKQTFDGLRIKTIY